MTSVYETTGTVRSPAPGPDRGPGVRVPPPLIYIGAFALGALGERLAPSPDPSPPLRIAAAAGGSAALLALDTNATIRFWRRGTTFNPARPATALVTDGPYRFTRNPMYLGMACAYAGAAVGSGRLWALATLPVAGAAVDRLVIPREERHLAETFGAEYASYRTRVRRWL